MMMQQDSHSQQFRNDRVEQSYNQSPARVGRQKQCFRSTNS